MRGGPLPVWGRLLGLVLLGCAPGLPALAAGPGPGAALDLETVVRQTLARNPAILLQERQVEAARGGMQQSAGQFDPVLQLTARRSREQEPLNAYYRKLYRASYGEQGGVDAIQSDTSGLSLGLDKPLRNGMVLSTSLSVTRSEGTRNDFQGWEPQNLGKVGFSINIPLLKGSGQAAVAGERASELEWQASRQELRQTLAQSLVSGVGAYWKLLAAGKSLEIAREGELGMERLLDDTRKLIAADELPAAEINLIQARLADRRSARIAAEQSLLQARQALGLAMGLPYGEAIAGLEVQGDFPPPPRQLPEQLPDARSLVERALARRPDLEAARLRQEAALVLADAARSNLRPQLDLNLGVGYAGLAEGGSGRHYYDAFGEHTTGASGGVTLSYRWALGNNSAEGGLAQRNALHDQASLNHYNLARSISLAVESTLAGLVRSARQLLASEESVAIYRVSLENERIKNRLGSSTILDVLSVDESLRNARLAHVNYQLNYLMALANLGYETGALVRDESSAQQVDLGRFVSMPPLNEAPE